MVTTVSAKQAVTGPHGRSASPGRAHRHADVAQRGAERRQAHDPLGAREVGYVVSGRAELIVGGETVTLPPAILPRPGRAEHTYRILETFTAVEATSPPAK